MSTTTLRVDTITAIKTTLDTYAAANPTLLTAAYKARPASFGDLPCAYIGRRQDTISVMTVAVMNRIFLVDVCLIDHISDNAEVMARMDVLVDALLGTFQAALRSITGNNPPLKIVGVESDEVAFSEGGAPYRRETITLRSEYQVGSSL